MGNRKSRQRDNVPQQAPPPAAPRHAPFIAAVVAVVAVALGIFVYSSRDGKQASVTSSVAAPAAPVAEMEIMETFKAVMVTIEIPIGGGVNDIPSAMSLIERRSMPGDGQGRTFAVLDAYGEKTADGKLHVQMHVSAEKPGVGMLIFKPTGQILWQSKIVAGAPPNSPFAGKKLGITLDDGTGKALLIDGSKGPATILDATINEARIPVRNQWLDGQEREVTFFYSACGCPVKAMVKRVGERTVRTKDQPLLFPDDPDAVAVISKLMGW